MTRFGGRSRRQGGAITPRNGLGGTDIAVAGVMLALGAVTHRYLPERTRPAAGAGAALGLVALACGLGVDARDLGVDARDLGSGLRVGAAAAAAIVTATGTARALDRQGTAFRDARVAEASRAQALVALMIRIPFATALGEEVGFRGVILGLGLRDGDRRRALVVSSVAFGLWHIGPALHPARQRASGQAVGHERTRAAKVAVGDVVATTIGGLGLGWLRLRAGSIVAPTMAHAALNSSAYLATRIRRGGAR